jgi:hypothetical protein
MKTTLRLTSEASVASHPSLETKRSSARQVLAFSILRGVGVLGVLRAFRVLGFLRVLGVFRVLGVLKILRALPRPSTMPTLPTTLKPKQN